MRNSILKILTVLGLVVFLTSQSVYGQAPPNHIKFSYIVDKLNSTSRNKKKNEKINDSLIKEIQERKVNFILTKQNEEFLRKKGSNDSLIKTIQENVSESVLESEKYFEKMEALYQKFQNNRKGPAIENYKIALEAAKEYLEKYEIVHPGDDVSRYIKYQIPKLEEKIKNLQNQ